MSIEYHVLGDAGRDNALLCYIHTGQANVRLLFDCGEGTLARLPFAEIQRMDDLCFSHLHMDHISGFDAFFRTTYNRLNKPNIVWGPPETARIIHHRLQGFMWNLHGDKQTSWQVCDISPGEIVCTRFELEEAFAVAHPGDRLPFDGTLLSTPDYTVEVVHLEHMVPSLGYIVRESPKLNIDVSRLEGLGLKPGAWLKQLKKPPVGATHIEVEGASFSITELQAALLAETPGDTLAYLTDFLLDDAAMNLLVPRLQGCKTIVCESAYRKDDLPLAVQNYHCTSIQAAELAREARAGKLVLIHLSDRYTKTGWQEMLAEARSVFRPTEFPRGWKVKG